MAIRELVFPIAQILQKRNDAKANLDFLATLYAAQLKIGTDDLWNREFVNGLAAFSKSSYVQGVIGSKIHSIPKKYNQIWNEYQVLMNDAHAILDVLGNLTAMGADASYYADRAGIVSVQLPATITLPSGGVIGGGGYATLSAYANAWNTLWVADAVAEGVEDIYYLTPVLNQAEDKLLRKTPYPNDNISGLYYTGVP